MIITVARKPLNGIITGNALKHESGGLNIDASRVDGVPPSVPQPTLRPNGVDSGHALLPGHGRNGQMSQANGRWPANLILSHLPGCRCVGTKQVAGGSKKSGIGLGSGHVSRFYGQSSVVTSGYADETGLEKVPDWRCQSGCPVAALDGQSGMQKSGIAVRCRGDAPARGPSLTGMGAKAKGTPNLGYADMGGASRFFKHIRQDPEATKE